MRTWGITDVGLVRSENQDAYDIRVMAGYTVAVVCDGMGGPMGGKRASTLAVELFDREMEASLKEGMSSSQLTQVMSYSAALANEAIYCEAQEDSAYEYMGTTMVSVVATATEVQILNVGDSRAYHIDRDGIQQITKDHSVVEGLVESGNITHEQAKNHPQRNLITKALGPEASVQPDCFEVFWKQGDFVLLCSDGLVNTVSDQEMLFEVIHNGEPDTCLERLLAMSKQRGAPDNVTAVLLMNI